MSTKVKIPYRQVCIGDLRHRIEIHTRDTTVPAFGLVDFDEKFTLYKRVWAAVKTVNGETFFDGVETERNVTHHFFVRHDDSVTSEHWVVYRNQRYDILRVESMDERQEFMRLVCTITGNDDREASKS